MKYVQKLVLVPIEEWEKLKKEIPKVNQLPNIQVEVKKLPPKKKLMKSGKNRVMEKQIVKQTLKQKKMKKKKKINQVKWIIDALPEKYKAKAFSLLRYITRNYNMKWTSDGIFKYKYKIIPNSNILHLVLHTLLKNIDEKPAGINGIYQGLTEVNVSEYLLANKLGKNIILGQGEDIDWGPLGELQSKRKRSKAKWNKK